MSVPEGIKPILTFIAAESIEIPEKSKYIAIKCNANNEVISIRGFGEEGDIAANEGYRQVSIHTMYSFYSDLSERELPDAQRLNCLKKISEAVKVLNDEIIRLFKKNFPEKEATGDITVKIGMDLAQKINDEIDDVSNPELKEKKEKDKLVGVIKEGEYNRFKFLLNKAFYGNANPKGLLNDLLNAAVDKYKLRQKDNEKGKQLLIIEELIKRGADGKAILDNLSDEDLELISSKLKNLFEREIFVRKIRKNISQDDNDLFRKFIIENMNLFSKYPSSLLIEDSNKTTVFALTAKLCLWKQFKEMIVLLKRKRPEIFDHPIDNRWPPLFHAAMSNEKRIVCDLIKNGANPNYKADYDGNTLLHILANVNRFDELEYYLLTRNDLQFNLGEKDSNGNTVLHLLAKSEQWELLAKLITKYKPNLNIKNNKGKTILHLIVDKLKSDYPQQDKILHLQFISALIKDHGADPNLKDNDDNTIIHLLLKNGILKSDEFKKFISKVDPSIQDQEGISILHLAATLGYWDLVVEFGLNNQIKKVNCNLLNKNGDTILHLAAKAGEWTLIVQLIEIDKRSNPNLQDKDGNTILHLAVKTGNWNVVRDLIKHGVSPNVRDKSRETVAAYAAKIDESLGISKEPTKNPLAKFQRKEKLPSK